MYRIKNYEKGFWRSRLPEALLVIANLSSP